MQCYAEKDIEPRQRKVFKRLVASTIFWLLLATLILNPAQNCQAAGLDGAVDPTFKSGAGLDGTVHRKLSLILWKTKRWG